MHDTIKKNFEKNLHQPEQGKILDLSAEILSLGDYQWLEQVIANASFLKKIILPKIDYLQTEIVLKSLVYATAKNSTLVDITFKKIHKDFSAKSAELYAILQSRFKRNKNKIFAIHGGGNIGLGLMADVVSKSNAGYNIIATSSNTAMRNFINTKNRVYLQHGINNKSDLTCVNNVKMISRSKDDIKQLYSEACIAALCLTPDALSDSATDIAEALIHRYEIDGSGIKILVLMNIPNCAEEAQAKIYDAMLAVTNDADYTSKILANVQFVPTIIDRIVTPIAKPAIKDKSAMFIAEKKFTMHVPTDFPEAYQFPVMTIATDLAQIEAIKNKFINGPHTILAWLGALKGHKTIAEAIRDNNINKYIQEMMELEIKPILMSEYPNLSNQELDRLKATFIHRCEDSEKDPVTRVGRDPMRKLNEGARIRGTLELCEKNDLSITTARIENGIAAGVLYGISEIDPHDHSCQKMREIFDGNKQSYSKVICYCGDAPSGEFKGLHIADDKSLVNNIMTKITWLKEWCKSAPIKIKYGLERNHNPIYSSINNAKVHLGHRI